jgi:hypothetical protein
MGDTRGANARSAGQDPPLLAPGTVVAGRLRIERVIGRGGMGVVYEAQHLHLQQRVALKVLYGDAAKDPESSARFVREAQIALSLTSPYIVRVHDLGVTDHGQPYIQMELLQGRGLDSVICAAGNVSVEQAVGLVLQACVGVGTAHATGLVHRDLKPENLFLTRQSDGSEFVKVLDFGISKVAPPHDVLQLTMVGTAFGTPQYMSPEQCVSAAEVDARCDQHALGLILYELLTKKPVFEGESETSITYQILAGKPASARVIRPDVAPPLDEAIQKTLAKQPRDRFRDVADFALAIAPFGGPSARADAEAIAKVLHHAPTDSTRAALPTGPVSQGAVAAHPAATTNGSFTRAALAPAKSGLPAIVWAAIAVVPIAAIALTSAFLFHRTEHRESGEASTASTSADAPASASSVAQAPAPSVSTAAPVASEAPPHADPSAAVASASAASASAQPPTASLPEPARPTAPIMAAPPKPAPAPPNHNAHQPIFQIPHD